MSTERPDNIADQQALRERLEREGLSLHPNNQGIRIAPVANRNVPALPYSTPESAQDARAKQARSRRAALRQRLALALARGFSIRLSVEEVVTLGEIMTSPEGD